VGGEGGGGGGTDHVISDSLACCVGQKLARPRAVWCR